MKNSINEDNIRVAAYYIWEQAGRPEGKEKECWIKACEQLFAANTKSCKCTKKPVKKTASKPVVKLTKTVALKSKPVTKATSSATKTVTISKSTASAAKAPKKSMA